MPKGKEWALILGASSGFGAATALELARSGLDVLGVHLDLHATLPNAQRVIEGVKAGGRVERRLMGSGGLVFAMPSAGATRVMKSYGPVSAAKAALESHVRQLALELAPLGITVNAIRAGVTDTPSLRRIPGGPELLAQAPQRNPSGRATTTEAVARAIAALIDARLYWMTGTVIEGAGEDAVTGEGNEEPGTGNWGKARHAG